jgi:hypothetical protein
MANTRTPNLALVKISADYKNWTQLLNDNFVILDATLTAFFAVNQLQGAWENGTAYTVGQTVVDRDTAVMWHCTVAHTSANIPTTFAQDRAAHSTYWTIFSAAAVARGTWTPNTAYSANDFVVSGSQYAVCAISHTSGAIFSVDRDAGKWSVLVDLSAAGSQVLPVPGGAADADKFVVVNSAGTGYTIVGDAAVFANLGFTTIGQALAMATSEAAARSAINAQVAGSYQTLSTYLTLISGLASTSSRVPYVDSGGAAALAPIGTFGHSWLALADLAAAKAALGGLGTAAPLNVGTTANLVVQLDGSAKLPAVDGSQLTNLPTGTAYFTTGDVKATYKTTADSGWIMMDDGTIGSATSGATTRANADTEPLYTLLWNNCNNTDCPVSTGRGASAAADFAANKTLNLPLVKGRAFAGAGTGTGLTARRVGQNNVGAETHTLSSSEMPSHTHSESTGSGTGGTGTFDHNYDGVASPALQSTTNTSATTGATGGGGSHNNMQPSTFMNLMIKL